MEEFVNKYCVTIKCNYKGTFVYKDDFETLMDDIFPTDNVSKIRQCYELDSNYNMHLHLSICTKHPLNYKDLMRKGWHIYIRRQVGGQFERWHNYMSKDPRDYETLLQERTTHYMIHHTNLFLEE